MRPGIRCAAALLLIVGLSGCFAGKTSPAQYGIDLRFAPGFALGNAGTSIHPTVAYARALLGGVEGESDGILHVGGQVRWAPQQTTLGGSKLWLGGEATYARRRTTFDFPGATPASTNGWTLAALAGLPVLEGTMGTAHAYAALGVNKYGGTGPYGRVSIDIQPAFLSR